MSHFTFRVLCQRSPLHLLLTPPAGQRRHEGVYCLEEGDDTRANEQTHRTADVTCNMTVCGASWHCTLTQAGLVDSYLNNERTILHGRDSLNILVYVSYTLFSLLKSYTYVHIYIRTCIRILVHRHTYTVYIYMHICIHTYIHSYIHSYIHTFIHTYIYTYIHSYIHTLYTYIHTCLHT